MKAQIYLLYADKCSFSWCDIRVVEFEKIKLKI